MAEATGLQGAALGLCTDLSQCTMAQRSLEHDQNRSAPFSLIVRTCPPNPTSRVAAGGGPGAGTLFAADLAVSAAEGALSQDLGASLATLRQPVEAASRQQYQDSPMLVV